MSVTASDIRDLPSGEFSSLTDAVINRFLAEAGREVNASVWGDRYDDGILYLTAHLLAFAKKGATGAAGPVTSETAGPLSISYGGAATASDAALASTSYGRRYLEIAHTLFGQLVL
jgi:hypothetical protein